MFAVPGDSGHCSVLVPIGHCCCLLVGGRRGAGGGHADPVRSRSRGSVLPVLLGVRGQLWWGVSVCVYGEEWEAADSSEEEEEIGLPPCSKVLARTAYRPVVPLALAIACMRRTTSSARIQGRTGERELVSTATTALLRGPPPGRTAPFIVSSDGDQIHLILDRSGSEGKKAPPRTARPRPCAVCDWRDSSAASAS